jgi:hypothetical protein
MCRKRKTKKQTKSKPTMKPKTHRNLSKKPSNQPRAISIPESPQKPAEVPYLAANRYSACEVMNCNRRHPDDPMGWSRQRRLTHKQAICLQMMHENAKSKKGIRHWLRLFGMSRTRATFAGDPAAVANWALNYFSDYLK